MQRFIINKPVFIGAVAITGLFVAVGVFLPSRAEAIFGAVQGWMLAWFGWLFLLTVAIFLGSVVFFAASRFGNLKLGPDESTPDFPYLSWCAMLFAAGMGIGLMYFGVGEPLTHYGAPPDAEPLTIAAQRQAMTVTFFHYGVHAWAIYAVVGLSLAYFGHRYNLPLTIRSGLYPLLKERINGPIGHAVDIFAICGTIFGVATSMGFGVLQINAGLTHLTGIPNSPVVQLTLIAIVTSAATMSVVSGVERGVRILSELNLVMAIMLMMFVLLVGPTALLLRDFVQNLGFYLDGFLLRTFNIYAYEPRPWIDAWTLFYWSWWISWSPFVGMFIARISRGRTVREFVIAVLCVPTGFTFIWMTIFGNTALFLDTTIAAGALSEAVAADMSVALFQFLEYLPWPAVTSTLAVVLIAVFFVTSADSGSLVVDTIASGGRTDTTTAQRVFWCALTGVVAGVLLVGGGLGALQSATIASALPFSLIMLLLIWGLARGMRADIAQRDAGIVARHAHPAAGPSLQRRLALLLNAPAEGDVRAHIAGAVIPALRRVAAQLQKGGVAARVEETPDESKASLAIPSAATRDFIYGVWPAAKPRAAFSPMEAGQDEMRHEARTYFSDGSEGYDLMAMTEDQIAADILVQFERYLKLVQAPETSLVVAAPEHRPTAAPKV